MFLAQNLLPAMGFYFRVHVKSRTQSFTIPEQPFDTHVKNFMLISVVLVLVGTLIDIYAPDDKLKLLKSFSLHRNLKSLFKLRSSNEFAFFGGLKVLAFIQIALGHVINSTFPKARYDAHKNLLIDPWFFLIGPLHVSVDTFFFISGFLVSYQFMENLHKG